jgi:hypothetical protein
MASVSQISPAPPLALIHVMTVSSQGAWYALSQFIKATSTASMALSMAATLPRKRVCHR